MSLQLGDLPPPGDKLRALVDNAQPVVLRRPLRQLALQLACACALGTLAVLGLHVRPDHAALPQGQLVVAAMLWALALVAGSSLAFLPEPNQVLPSLRRARLGLALVLSLALVAGVALAADSDASRHLSGMAAMHGAVHCARFGLLLAAPIFALGWWQVLRRMPVGGAIVGATLGAAAGALSGLALHLVCGVGGAMHSLFGHVTVVLLGAAVGAISAKR